MTIAPLLRYTGKSWLLIMVLFNIGCQWQSQLRKEVTMTDINLLYHWDTGSIPPPDYYEYEIIVRPTQEGEINFRPDYPAADIPTWKQRFKISDGDYSNLWHAIQQLSTVEKETGPHIGGSRETLSLQYAGSEPLEKELASSQGRRVAQMIKNSVPQDTWQKLFNAFESYREERR